MDTLFDNTGIERFEDPSDWLRTVRELAEKHGEDAWPIVQMCLNAFSLARAFFCISADKKAYDDVQRADRTIYLGMFACKFRSAFFRIGEYRLKCDHCSATETQSLREMESCYRWLKKNNLFGWRVMSCQENGYDPNGHMQYEWVDLEPSQMVSKILDAYKQGIEAIRAIS